MTRRNSANGSPVMVAMINNDRSTVSMVDRSGAGNSYASLNLLFVVDGH